MSERLLLLFRHAMYNLRGGFLVRPLTIALVLGGAGAVLSWIEETNPEISDVVPRTIFPSHADPQVAQVILGDIGGSIMTVVSIVFAILLMTLTLASMQFSPRIILGISRDGVTQWTLGVFLGTFCYCIAALPAARSYPKPFAPVLTVSGAMLLALICVAWLLFFIHHISNTISVNQIVDKIASETEIVIDEMMPSPRKALRLTADERIDELKWDLRIPATDSGYIRFIDLQRLVVLAKTYHVKIQILRRVGHFVPQGVPLLAVSRAERITPERAEALRSAFDLGPSRTLQQDVEFGVLLIVDIALRAISPAVNDPSTAITCVDQLSRILIRVASREPPESFAYDPPGTLRLYIPWPSFDRLLDAAFEQIRMYSKTDVAVSLRILRALGDIAVTTPDPEIQQLVIDRARRIVDGCMERLNDDELLEIRSRYDTLLRGAKQST